MRAAEREARYVFYGAGNLGKSLLWMTADITLLYVLTDFLGVAPALAGALFLIGLIFDALLDPVVATWTERAGARAGQYGPFLLFGAPLCAGAFAVLYSLPNLAVSDVAVIGACIIVFRASYAAIDLPHTALIAKIAASSRARGRIAGYRFFFTTLGSLFLAVCAPLLLRERDAGGLQAGALIAAALSVLIMYASFFSVRQFDQAPRATEHSMNWRRRVGDLFRNRAFCILAAVAFMTGLSAPLFGKFCIYYAQYVLRDASAVQAALTALVIGQFVGVALWSWLADWTEKGWALAASHSVAAAAFIGVGVLTPMTASVLAALACIAGVGLSGIYMLLWGIAPDIVDFGELKQGVRHEASAFAILILLMKLAIGLGAWVAGEALQIAGYVPGVRQSGATQAWIVFLTSAAPALGCLVCAGLAARHRLTHARHAAILKQLARRAERRASVFLNDRNPA